MKRIRETLFVVLAITAMSFGVAAQKEDKTPKKPPPPVIKPGEKPKDDKDKPKKPNSILVAEYTDSLIFR